MTTRFSIAGLGEALFDVFPHGEVLGGAPLNMAVHAHQLARGRDGEGVVVSRVGQDEPGQRVLDQLAQRGVNTQYLQSDPDRQTGEVYVGVDEHGEPDFQIVDGVAWDWLQFDPDLESFAKRCEAVCFGSLAQRTGQSRNTIYRFLEAAGRAIKLFDVNLRQQYHNRNILDRSCQLATAVKLNQEELPIVCQTLGIPFDAGKDTSQDDYLSERLLKKYRLRFVALTRGKDGTVLYTSADRFEGQRAAYARAEGADSVGPGDACSAAILVGLVLRMDMQRTANLANHVGAYVASQPGGTPELPQAILDMVKG